MITVQGFHIELTNICTLKCPECERTKLISQYPKFWKNHSITLKDLQNFLDIDLKGLHFLLCGQYGDPIYHPECLEIVTWIKQQGASIMMHTNGSYKDSEWWHSLGRILDANDTVVFSIDGHPDNFTEYRINADWPSIETAIKTLREYAVKTQWKYIVFNYNESTIDSTIALARDLGINQFVKEYSDRFSESSTLKPSEQHIDVRFFIKNNTTVTDINPRCSDGKQHYISADGYYMPCCHMGTKPVWFKTEFGQSKEHYCIRNFTFTELLDRTQSFYQTLSDRPLFICQRTCSSQEAPICNQHLASILN